MKLTSFLAATLAAASAVSATTIVWNTPNSATTWTQGQVVTLSWTFYNVSATDDLPGVKDTDVAVFHLQDLRAGSTTGQNIGNPIGQAPLSAGTLTGSLPNNLVTGNSFSIRADIAGSAKPAYSGLFTIVGQNTTAPTTTAAATTTTAATTSATTSKTSTTATPTQTQAGNSGAGAVGGNGAVLGAIAVGLAAALA
ncbi:hypothetical protein HDV00_008321 [Rhizophlyctis rosea]|nr:hypothetical protein HDV00_008321 [Rhizophlyctis rosea]